MTTAALLYQPTRSWRVAVAFGAAALIHFAAIALANFHRVEETGGAVFTNNFTDIFVEPDPTIADPTTETPDPVPTPPQTDDSFPEQNSTPPPVRPLTNKRIPPIVKPGNNRVAGPLALSSARVFAISAPRPEYPYEARRQRIKGDGVVAMTIDPLTGRIAAVSMAKSTGSPFLDNAALTGFRKWRFKPGTVSTINCPVTFTLTGVSY
jgi:TonB family protein